ncbi:MAG: adenosine monophosphate-protein transferase, partial [Bartonella sp.]|nr:adenosine monophosphate-protein transferase [Bartonella sp.]
MYEASIAAAQDGNLKPMEKLFDDISSPPKTAILKEFISNTQKLDQENINNHILVTADEGVTYKGIYKGESANSIILKTGDIYTIFSKDCLTPEQLKPLKLNNEYTLTIPMEQNLKNPF